MKSPFKVAYVPYNIANAAPIGGASLIIPKGNSPERQAGGLDADPVADQPGDLRRLEPVHRLLLAREGGLRPAGDAGLTWARTPTRRSHSTSSTCTAAPGSRPTTRSACARRSRTRCRPCCPAAPSPPRRPALAQAERRRATQTLCRTHRDEACPNDPADHLPSSPTCMSAPSAPPPTGSRRPTC